MVKFLFSLQNEYFELRQGSTKNVTICQHPMGAQGTLPQQILKFLTRESAISWVFKSLSGRDFTLIPGNFLSIQKIAIYCTKSDRFPLKGGNQPGSTPGTIKNCYFFMITSLCQIRTTLDNVQSASHK